MCFVQHSSQFNAWREHEMLVQWMPTSQLGMEYLNYRSCYLDIVIVIIIIKKGQQCKTGREWYTPYQSEDHSPTIPTYRQKEEKGKESRRL